VLIVYNAYGFSFFSGDSLLFFKYLLSLLSIGADSIGDRGQ